MDPEVRSRLLISIDEGRLVVLCGAGLSMGTPTCLPSAAELARHGIARYEETTGESIPEECREDLEAFTRYLHSRDELISPFVQSIVPWGERFQRNANHGHLALADFLLCHAIIVALSTNFDTHIEDAAFDLGEGDLEGCLSGDEVNAARRRYSPLLKLHGCFRRDRLNTVWIPEQLETEPLAGRIASSHAWIAGNLQGRDLLLVGFWSDWDYLNEVLEGSVSGVRPRSVIVVDPAALDALQDKAPKLWTWINESGAWFRHEKEYGERFLDELRSALARQFFRRLDTASRPQYSALFGADATVTLPEGEQCGSDDFYSWRRDLTGRSPAEPVRSRSVDGLEMTGAVLLRIIELSGEVIGRSIQLNGEVLRILTTPNALLSQVQAAFDEAYEDSGFVDRAICVGALRDGAPGNVVRAGGKSSVVRRGFAQHWMTLDEYLGRLQEVA